MQRIVLRYEDRQWLLERDGQEVFSSPSLLEAAIAAKEYGETFRGRKIGYVIRLEHPETLPETMLIIHSQLF